MEFSNSMEDEMVLHYLKKMQENALKQIQNSSLDDKGQQWIDHLEVINRAIDNARPIPYPIKKTA